MSDVIICYDSTDPEAIPADAEACAGYCDAMFASSWIGMVHRFPHLSAQSRVVSIGSRAGTVCRIFDLEQGNPLTPAEMATEVVKMVRSGVYKPGAYCTGSALAAVRAALKATGLRRRDYSIWLAAPDGQRPTAAYLREHDLDGIQYGWSSKGQAPRGTDVSAFLPDFFPPLQVGHDPKPAHTPAPKPKHKRRPKVKPHPKVTAAMLASAMTTIVLGLLAKHGATVHLTTAESAAITGAAAALAAQLRKS